MGLGSFGLRKFWVWEVLGLGSLVGKFWEVWVGKFWVWEVLGLGSFGFGKFWAWEVLGLGSFGFGKFWVWEVFSPARLLPF